MALATRPSINDRTIADFGSMLRGSVIRPADPGYDTARTLFNAMIDRRPALIAHCMSVADVIAAVRFAGDHGLRIAVRGGGHNVAGTSLCDGGLVIDLSAMRAVRVDPACRTARAEGGATWRDFDHATQTFGLATTGGTISTTGIAGLTLGGGQGYLMRKHGLACDNLISADVVLADGSFVAASEKEHSDLFWALRGGGGNFGVVTAFEYRLHPVGPAMGGMVIHPVERAAEAFRFYREFQRDAPDALVILPTLLTAPDGAKVAALIAGYTGPVEDGEAALAPLRRFGPPVADTIQPMPYTAVQRMLDDAFPPGHHHYWKSGYMRELSDGAIETMVAQFLNAPSPLSAALLEPVGGAVARVAPDATAYAHRNGQPSALIVARWADPAEAEREIAWARAYWAAMQPYVEQAAYPNYLEAGAEGAERVRAAYGGNYARLTCVKAAYDPTNFFRGNQNIPPAS
ncbi:MAG TPA: FAD-binding oxidoreductase [Thermomicrobiales bacterium]|jgi:FAD/FMN-containing dehydrogenase